MHIQRYIIEFADADACQIVDGEAALLNELSGLYLEECPRVSVWAFNRAAGNRNVTREFAAKLADRTVEDGDLRDMCQDDAIPSKYFRPFSVTHAPLECDEMMRDRLAERLEVAA